MSFWSELKRRNVFKVGAVYVIVAWVILQAVSIIFPMLHLPSWTGTFVTVLIIIGFPVALIFAWAFELTADGVKRTSDVSQQESITHVTGQKLNYVLGGLLFIAVALLIFDNYYLDRRVEQPEVASTDAEQSPVAIDVEEAPKTIAVLPFADMSPDKDQEYFVDGLSEELLNSLTKIKKLQVVARTSSFAFKGTNKTVQEIAEVLGADHVLEGSVRKAGNSLRITAQLIRAADGIHLWSETYDRELKDIFTIQEDIAVTVANELKVTLGVGKSLKQLGGTQNEEAYELYLAAKGQSYSPSYFTQGKKAVDAALAIDPDFALAWAYKAFFTSAGVGLVTTENTTDEGLNAVQKAIELEPNLVEAHLVLGHLRMQEGDWIGAERSFQKAIELNTELSPGFGLSFAVFNIAVGHVEKGNEFLKTMRKKDPLNQPVRLHYMISLLLLGDRQGAIDEFERGRKLFGDEWIGNPWRAIISLGPGAEVSSADVSYPGLVNDAVRDHIDSQEKGLEVLHRIYANDIALIFADLGEISVWASYFGNPDFALDALEKGNAINAGNMETAWVPVMYKVRQLPRFKELVREIGLVDYWNEFGWPDICRPLDNGDFECD